MKKSWWIIPVLVFFIIACFRIYQNQQNINQDISTKKKQTPDSADIVHSSRLFDPDFFHQAYELGINYRKIIPTRILGGIIPHHLLAAPLIAGFFAGIQNPQAETVILLGPNHFNSGPFNITTSQGSWKTLYGNLYPDNNKLKILLQNKTVRIHEDLFDNEHSISAITGFIRKSFPLANLIPIILKSSTTQAECDSLVNSLNNLFDSKTIILTSVDFSHYQTSHEADTHDAESLRAIGSFDLARILSLDYEKNFDSPASIYVLLKLMQIRNADNMILIANTNSAKLTNQETLSVTTSYVTMYFTNPQANLSFDSIFQYHDPFLPGVNNNSDAYSLIATGDVIPARSVNAKTVALNNFNFPFEKISTMTKSADAAFINLESPLIPGCPVTNEGMIFCGDERNVQGLKYAGVDIVSLANNHLGNYGLEGITNTVNLLEGNNIAVTGHGPPAIVRIKNKKFGFIGFNDIDHQEEGIAWADRKRIISEIDNFRDKVDFVIVAFHWGTEYTSDPNNRQIELAHTAIDAGADLVIGNHPHWVQGIEQYNGKFITFAHGNLVFDQMWSQHTREGVIGKYIFNDQGFKDVKFYPVIIEDYSQPRFATRDEALVILDRMKNSSIKLRI